ncbi:2-hexaprenyl-6-methoxy-1,4-benzoquinone methyltransferase [Chytridiales sp. JEL 0842]|nr:2-hexaprenyl-6-methoxy-1,4-benzoquinone methyltransferase [Chytridiales sp. JEL 0842]
MTGSTILRSSCTVLRASQRLYSSTPDSEKYTHFGFKTIPEEQKEQMVGAVFHNVAKQYDIMNDAMSAGVHRLWKDHFISTLNPTKDMRLLDVAGGTGDIAFRFLNSVKAKYGPSNNANVTVVDINPSMLQVGRERAPAFGYGNSPQISFQEGNAESLENIPSESVDAYTIAFGIRNCTHVDKVLEEAYRVLKPGGRFMCLEFGHVDTPIVKNIYDIYSFEIIPFLGGVIANDKESYQYLVESIRKFPRQTDFANMIRKAGFQVRGKGWEDLTFGVAAIHSGFKAGATVEIVGSSSAKDCLDHGDRSRYQKTCLELPIAHIPGKLPKNITDLTNVARKMTHGLHPMPGPTAGQVIFPSGSNPILQKREAMRERIYHRREHQVLGRSVPLGTELPDFTNDPEFRFGQSTIEEETVAEIMYPPEEPESENAKDVRRQYIISHNSYEPGEQRKHYGDNFVAPEPRLEGDCQDSTGRRTKEVLYWTEEHIKETQTKLSSKRLEDWRERRQPQIGKVHDPLKSTMEHLPTDYTFGIKFPADDYRVGDLLGFGEKARAAAALAEQRAAESKAKGIQEPPPSNMPRSKAMQVKLKWDRADELSPKITGTAMGGIRPQRFADVSEKIVFGVPTVRRRRPGFVKRLSDNTTYSDELDAKALLIPTPANIYGEDLIKQLENFRLHYHVEEKRDYFAPIGPAKVLPALRAST